METQSTPRDSSACGHCAMKDICHDGSQLDKGDLKSDRKPVEEDSQSENIEAFDNLDATELDLREKRLGALPDVVLELSNLQRLYLQDNDLGELPEEFFLSLPELQWLDLRNNKLTQLPSEGLSSHRSLQNLLLGNNRLSELPQELGYVKSLTGLSIQNNPLISLPESVQRQGTAVILKFLRNEYIQESESGTTMNSGSSSKTLGSNKSNCSSSTRKKLLTNIVKTKKSYIKKSDIPVDLFPAPPPEDRVDAVAMRKQYLDLVKQEKMQQEVVLQKRRDIETIKSWREKAKMLQNIKDRQRKVNGFIDFNSATDTAPFRIEPKFKRMMTNEERLLTRDQCEYVREARPVSPSTRIQCEIERLAEEQTLQQLTKEHVVDMQARRSEKPNENPRKDLAAAYQELRVAEELHKRLQARRYELEHRYQAYIGKRLF